jgi:branched-chain amino acid transport system ATP-binding protein
MMLKVEGLTVRYGNIEALHGINVEVNKGEIVTLIGANGAGKTTTLHSVSGIIPKVSGRIEFLGQDLEKVSAEKRVEMGLVQVPEGRRMFANLTVQENLEMGAYLPRVRKRAKANMENVMERFPRLRERCRQLSGTLSGGEQQMLAIGRALMSEPTLLLMDEPSMGLAPMLVQEIFSIIRWINQQGVTILLVEQNAHMALNTANRAYVLETGRIVMEGPSAELRQSEEIRKAYLG